jgi:hypothetical protein
MMRAKKYTSHGPASFLKNTYEILCDESLSSIVSWTEDGTSFIIFDIYNFANIVLPRYFKHSNLASFIRQLNNYGFSKIKLESSMSLQFTHPVFRRDNKHMLKEIRRKNNDWCDMLSPAEDSGILAKLELFKSQQNRMQNMMDTLENQYSEILMQNQILVSELFQSQEREKRLENLLRNITQKTREEVSCPEERDEEKGMMKMEPNYPDDGEKEEKREEKV